MISPATESSTLTLVISKGQSRNPEKRGLEQGLAQAASQLDGVRVMVVPHLYDLPKTSDAYRQLSELDGDLVIASWIFPRAAHWVLDRNGIRGRFHELDGDDADRTDAESAAGSVGDVDDAASIDPSSTAVHVTDLFPRPTRTISCVDLKTSTDVQQYLTSIRQLAGDVDESVSDLPGGLPVVGGSLVEVEESTKRRWYPVIDFDRCTNCMECIDFCLFGVYGVDGAETILVEQPDNCRKGCPACSRVCPENAIIFPQHKAPAIAGAATEGDEGFKIDLSQLFGAPAGGGDAIETAARERDEQLLLAGRDAIGIDDQLRRRQSDLATQPKDDLDNLIDSLDALDL